MDWLLKTTGIGHVLAVQASHQPRPVWRWIISAGVDVVQFLELIRPFLIIKRDHADIAMSVRHLIDWSKLQKRPIAPYRGAPPMPESIRLEVIHLQNEIRNLNNKKSNLLEAPA